MKRVLLTTAYSHGENFDLYFAYKPNNQIVRIPIEQSIGLRFISKNVEGINILEFPTRDEYIRELKKGWDVVGFSFYTNDTNKIRDMVELTRKENIPELWGGNYGAFSPDTEKLFDKVFLGFSEQSIAKELGQNIPDSLIHPSVNMDLYVGGISVSKWGVINTQRGCKFSCDFCQAQALKEKPTTISIESIDEILWQYCKRGIKDIIIFDETFGAFPKYSDEIAKLLSSYKMRWNALTRLDVLENKLDKWIDYGLVGVQFGVETIDTSNLSEYSLNGKAGNYKNIIHEIDNAGLGSMAFYIVGFENDTRESLAYSLEEFLQLPIDMPSILILTPFINTPLWDQIEKKYGIWDKDPSHYDLHHLVWNHPAFEKGELETIQRVANNRSKNFSRFSHIVEKVAKNVIG